VVSSAIMGIGSSEWPKRVRWAKAKEIVSTWVITIPSAGLVAATMMVIAKIIMGF
jgi:PiT family inorganic phosphate transporter